MCLKKIHSARLKHLFSEKAVHLTKINTMRLSDNPYAWDIQSAVTMDDLFVL